MKQTTQLVSRVVSLVMLIVLLVTANTACAEDVLGEHSLSKNPDVPMSVILAGKKVDLDRVDMYERFDRELTQMIYGHTNTLLVIKRANRYFPMMAPILEKNGIPSDMLYLAAIESTLSHRAYSPAKAAGIWQFLAATGRDYGLEVSDEVDERFDPELSTIAACKYLKAAYSRYGDWASVAASYNGGMGRISGELNKQQVNTALDLYLTEETSRYVFRIMAMKLIMENPRHYGFLLRSNQLYQPIDYDVEIVNGPVASWSEWAKQYGITYMELRDMNPWIRSSALTNKARKEYKVKVPKKDQLLRSKQKIKVYNKKWVVD